MIRRLISGEVIRRLMGPLVGAGVIGLLLLVWALSPYRPTWHVRQARYMPYAFSPAGDFLVAGTILPDEADAYWRGGWPLRFLRIEDGQEFKPPLDSPVKWHPDDRGWNLITRAVFSPDGRFLAVLTDDTVRFERLEVFECVSRTVVASTEGRSRRSKRRPISPGRGITFQFDSQRLLWGHDGQVVLYDLEAQRPLLQLVAEWTPALSRDGRLLATLVQGSFDKQASEWTCLVRIRDLATGGLRWEVSLPVWGSGAYQTLFSADGRWLITATHPLYPAEATIDVWDTTNGQRLFQAQGEEAIFLEESQTLVTRTGWTLDFWDIKNWQQQATVCFYPNQIIRSHIVEPPPPFAAADCSMAIADMRPLSRPSLSTRLGGGRTIPGSALLDRLERQVLAENRHDSRISVLNTSTRDAILLGTTHLVDQIVLSPDGKHVAACLAGNGGLLVWDISPRRSLVPLVASLAILASVGPIVFWWRRRAAARLPLIPEQSPQLTYINPEVE